MFYFYAIVTSASIFYASMTHFEVLANAKQKHERFRHLHYALMKQKSYDLALKVKVRNLETRLESVRADYNYLAMKSGKNIGRLPASQEYQADYEAEEKDYVQWGLFQWPPEKMLAIADHEFEFKRFLKSAQFYRELIGRFPDYEEITDMTYFKAGVAAYESKAHYDWAIDFLARLETRYPKSELKRNAELWLALSYLQVGEEKRFYDIVEKFRKKYRNTDEWKILSKHYEKITLLYGR